MPPNGSKPSNGEVDLGTGKYLIAGVHESVNTSEACSSAESVCTATGFFAALDETAKDEDERIATCDEDCSKDCAEEDSTFTADDDCRTSTADEYCAEDDSGTAELDTGATDAGCVAEDSGASAEDTDSDEDETATVG